MSILVVQGLVPYFGRKRGGQEVMFPSHQKGNEEPFGTLTRTPASAHFPSGWPPPKKPPLLFIYHTEVVQTQKVQKKKYPGTQEVRFTPRQARVLSATKKAAGAPLSPAAAMASTRPKDTGHFPARLQALSTWTSLSTAPKPLDPDAFYTCDRSSIPAPKAVHKQTPPLLLRGRGVGVILVHLNIAL